MSVRWAHFRVEFLQEECVRRGISVPTGAVRADLLELLQDSDPPTFYNDTKPGESSVLLDIMNQLTFQQNSISKMLERRTEPRLTESIPVIDGEKIHEYFAIFDRVASTEGWSEDVKLNILTSKLRGRARSAFLTFPSNETTSYLAVKSALLLRFSLTPDYYRQQFRCLKIFPEETCLEFSYKLRNLLLKWLCPPDDICNNAGFIQTLDLIGLEQFYSQIPADVRIWLMDRKCFQLSKAAALADEYIAVRQTLPVRANATRYGQPSRPNFVYSGTTDSLAQAMPSQFHKPFAQSVEKDGRFPSKRVNRFVNARGPDGQVICNFCQLPGHVSRICPSKSAEVQQLSEPLPFNNLLSDGAMLDQPFVHTAVDNLLQENCSQQQ